jgi:pyruvate/2-oxoglutarate dehydrogenase complex dihydrolipoamide dehydrogenase (E3) component/uncharacterized membrane protein YdjX (TVP38/TMEM64 family)
MKALGRGLALAVLVAVALVLILNPELRQGFSLAQLQQQREAWSQAVSAAPLRHALGFVALYVALAALSFPGATVLTLAGGALFGFWSGLGLVIVGASLGALAAFAVARYLLREPLQARYAERLAPVNAGIARDGLAYLLTLRLVPVFPFWLINLLMALTPMRARDFFVVSLVGMLPATAVYVNAGTRLAQVGQLADVLSPALLGAFALLGLFPWLAKGLVAVLRRRRLYARWTRPRRFDRNLIVIGAGAGGLVTSYLAAALRARVTLVEAHRMGGDCLNTGCVPSKALIRAAKAAHEIRHAERFGLEAGPLRVDFAAVMERVAGVVRAIEPHDSAARYESLGVEVLAGRARLVSPWQVEVELNDGSRRALSAPHLVIATGAQPVLPAIPGLAELGALTSDTVWSLREAPERLLLLGGGPIGCELAQAFARLGVAVTLIEMAPQLMGREDADVAALVRARLEGDGVRVLTGHQALRAERDALGRKSLVLRAESGQFNVAGDVILCAVGRRARVEGFGLEELGLTLTPRGSLQVNAQLQTRLPNVYAVGDVAAPYQFTHLAGHMAWTAAVNALFGRFKRFPLDLRALPWVTYTDPEVARVGLSEREAAEQGLAVEVTRYALAESDRAICEDATEGFVKLLTAPGRGRLLGVTVVGPHAGEMLAEFVLAMKQGLGLDALLATIHAYPTWADANKAAAGAWKRAHAPQRVLAWLERLHRWERG